jgi:hypothetical protein
VENHVKTEGWWLDLAASSYMTYTSKELIDIRVHKTQIFTGNGPIMSTHKGTAIVAGLILEDVLVVSNLPRNLVSVAKLQDNGMNVSLKKVSGNGKEAGIKRIGNFFKLEEAYTMEKNIIEIHKRYGYASFYTLKSLYSHLVPASPPQYDEYIKGKTRKPSSPASDEICTNRPG